jgi:hypothetical protein
LPLAKLTAMGSRRAPTLRQNAFSVDYALLTTSRVSAVSPFSRKPCTHPSTRFHPPAWPAAAAKAPANPSCRNFTSVPLPARRGALGCKPCTPVASTSHRTTVLSGGTQLVAVARGTLHEERAATCFHEGRVCRSYVSLISSRYFWLNRASLVVGQRADQRNRHSRFRRHRYHGACTFEV